MATNTSILVVSYAFGCPPCWFLNSKRSWDQCIFNSPCLLNKLLEIEPQVDPCGYVTIYSMSWLHRQMQSCLNQTIREIIGYKTILECEKHANFHCKWICISSNWFFSSTESNLTKLKGCIGHQRSNLFFTRLERKKVFFPLLWRMQSEWRMERQKEE